MAKACLVEGSTEGISFKSKESAVMAGYLRFTDRQADAILDMRLYKLIGLEIEALVKEHEDTLANIYRYEDILERKSSMAQVILNDLEAMKKEYSRERRTSIENCGEVAYEEKKPEEVEVYCLIDRFGYTRVIDTATFERNRDAVLSENRFAFPCKNTGRICLFTDTGQLYTVRVSDLPLGRLREKGVPLDNVSNFDSAKEQLLMAASQSDLNLYRVLFVTAQAMAKTVDGGEFDVTKKTVSATRLSPGDRVVDVTILKDQKNIVLQSVDGYFLRFCVEEIPEKKKTAIGVRAMRLAPEDAVEAVYYDSPGQETSVSYKSRTLTLGQIRAGKRDQKGVRIRG